MKAEGGREWRGGDGKLKGRWRGDNKLKISLIKFPLKNYILIFKKLKVYFLKYFYLSNIKKLPNPILSRYIPQKIRFGRKVHAKHFVPCNLSVLKKKQQVALTLTWGLLGLAQWH